MYKRLQILANAYGSSTSFFLFARLHFDDSFLPLLYKKEKDLKNRHANGQKRRCVVSINRLKSIEGNWVDFSNAK